MSHQAAEQGLAKRDSDPFTRRELIALKALANQSRKKFWNDYSLLIALLAFLLSLITAIISLYLGYKKGIQEELAELATAIRTIQELQLKDLELLRGNSADSRAGSLIANQIYNTNMMAADVALRVGTNATTALIIPLSQGLYHYGQRQKAEQLANIGLDAARTSQDETTALRWLGRMKMEENTATSLAEGNGFFARALNFEQKYGVERNDNSRAFIYAGIHIEWADALARFDCEKARNHFIEAVVLLNSAGHNPSLDRSRRNAQLRFSNGIGDNRSCLPASSTPALQ